MPAEQIQRNIEALSQASKQHPALVDYFELHKRIYTLQEQARSQITGSLQINGGALQARVARGIPQLVYSQLPIEPAGLQQLALDLAHALMDYDPDLAAQAPSLKTVDWVTLARERFEQGMATKGEQTGEPDLLQATADLALQPYLRWAAEQVLSHIDQARWKQRYCPVCGGPPNFALLDEESGARHLLCSRCNSQWLYRRLECPFCGTNDYAKLQYYPSEDEVYRLYVCQECKCYLKAIDLRRAKKKVILSIEPIITVAMDVAARQEGYN